MSAAGPALTGGGPGSRRPPARSGGWLSLLAAGVGLCGSLLVAFLLHQAAVTALEGVLEARLRGAGGSAALLLAREAPSPELLSSLRDANALDGAYVVDARRRLVADASGASGSAGLLRVDAARVERALRGEVSIAPAYALGELAVATAYFPIPGRDGQVSHVLGLEAGASFASAREAVDRAFTLALVLGVLGAGALAVIGARWTSAERARLRVAEKTARASAVATMAAAAAHEIRNPLAVIRGTVELMIERRAGELEGRDREALDDVLGEVQRLRTLTDDLLELSADRPLERRPAELVSLLGQAIRAAEVAHPSARITAELPAQLHLEIDPGRLRQVLANLLTNAVAAQDGGGEVEVSMRRGTDGVHIRVRDRGPGIPEELRPRLFELFMTSRSGGTGLGLALSRRIAERHGGTLELVDGAAGRTTFELCLPMGRG